MIKLANRLLTYMLLFSLSSCILDASKKERTAKQSEPSPSELTLVTHEEGKEQRQATMRQQEITEEELITSKEPPNSAVSQDIAADLISNSSSPFQGNHSHLASLPVTTFI